MRTSTSCLWDILLDLNKEARTYTGKLTMVRLPAFGSILAFVTFAVLGSRTPRNDEVICFGMGLLYTRMSPQLARVSWRKN